MAVIDLTSLAALKAWQAPPVLSSTDDLLLARLITAASSFILNYLQRPMLLSRSYSEARDGDGGRSLVLRQWPVTAIAAVAIDGIGLAPAADGTAGWLLDPWDGWSAGRPQRLLLRGGRFARGVQNVSVDYVAGYLVASEAQTIPASPGPYRVMPDRVWAADGGVRYAAGGALTPVAADPAPGQYVAPAGLGGAYSFSASDAGAPVLLSYSYVPDDLQQACIALVSLRYAERARIGQVSKSLAGEVVAFTQKDMQPDVEAALQPYRRVFTP